MTSPATPLSSPPLWRNPAVLAALVTAVVIAAQSLTVTINYHGDWTALFCAGSKEPLPPDLESRTYRFPNSHGYDGQMYRLIARDPWLQKGYALYLDNPVLRYGRILLPAAAWLLTKTALAGPDAAYIALVWTCAFFGVFWLARFLSSQSLDPRWAACFPLLPAALISLDRMTVDIALAALLAALPARWERARPAEKIAWLAACALVRDLGFLVVAAAVLHSAYLRKWLDACLFTLAGVPALAWYAWLHSAIPHLAPHTASSSSAILPPWLFTRIPGSGILSILLRPLPYALPAPLRILTEALDFTALLALLTALLLAFVYFSRRPARLDSWLLLCFACLFFATESRGFYKDPFSYTRAYTPMLALVAWRGVRTKQRWAAAPLAAISFRVLWQMGGQVAGIFRYFS